MADPTTPIRLPDEMPGKWLNDEPRKSGWPLQPSQRDAQKGDIMTELPLAPVKKPYK